MAASGSCQLLPGLSSASAGPIAINQPVGRGSLARPCRSSRWTDCGPKTNAAIARFQQVQLKIFDGVIAPNKKTILKLNEILEPVSTRT